MGPVANHTFFTAFELVYGRDRGTDTPVKQPLFSKNQAFVSVVFTVMSYLLKNVLYFCNHFALTHMNLCSLEMQIDVKKKKKKEK